MAISHAQVWQQATVVETTPVAERIRRIILAPDEPERARAGEHVDILVGPEGNQDIRSYSVVETSESGDRLTLSVLHTANSRGGSEWMHSLVPGDRITMTQPLQDFPLRIGAPRYVLLAGGIGVTALIGMAKVLERLRADVRFVYAGRTRGAMAYLDTLRERHGDQLEVHVDDEGTSLDVAQLIAETDATTELYMCGPIRLMDAVRRAWIAADRPISNLRYETFGNSGWFDPEEFELTVPDLGISTTVRKNESLLEALERTGAAPMFDCRKGECGLCQVTVRKLNGVVDHRDIFYSERQKAIDPPAKVCACVSRVATGSVASPASGCRPHLVLETP